MSAARGDWLHHSFRQGGNDLLVPSQAPELKMWSVLQLRAWLCVVAAPRGCIHSPGLA